MQSIFYEKLHNRLRKFYDLPKPKRPEKLPVILSLDEVRSILKATENLKHRAILMAAHTSGLILSEVINPEIKDRDSKLLIIHVRQGKSKKGCYVMLRELFLDVIKWVKWEKGLFKMACVRWLKKKYKENPNLFPHWKLVHP